jgi:mannose-6-phosphate isomerase-like protein (cupin superfamily)
MDYIRHVDRHALEAAPDRYTQALFDHTTGATSCSINVIKTPAGAGSPAGMHTHEVDQIFYVLSGVMSVEIEGRQYDAGPGSLIVFPAGMPHRNWNGGSEPTVHLAFNTPMPDPSVPFARPVQA